MHDLATAYVLPQTTSPCSCALHSGPAGLLWSLFCQHAMVLSALETAQYRDLRLEVLPNLISLHLLNSHLSNPNSNTTLWGHLPWAPQIRHHSLVLSIPLLYFCISLSLQFNVTVIISLNTHLPTLDSIYQEARDCVCFSHLLNLRTFWLQC